MGLFIFVLIAVTVVVLFFMIALGRISFSASMIIFAIILLVSLIYISMFVPFGLIMKVGVILLAISIVFGAVSYFMASGLTSLFWWINKDTTQIEKQKTKTCPKCGTENVPGRLFCVECGEKMLHPNRAGEGQLKLRACPKVNGWDYIH